MRILHLLPMNKLSGAERVGLLICKHMTGVESFVLTGGEELANVFIKEGIEAYPVHFSIKNMLGLTSRLKAFIEEKNIDLIHAHDNLASLAAIITQKRYGLTIKVVSHIHSCYPWLKSKGVHYWIDRWIRPRYDYNIACGKIVFDYYQANATYFKSEATTILSNAIDCEGLTNVSVSRINEIKERFNLESNQTIIGYIGRLVELKGIIPFIKALSSFHEDFHDCKFLIVGSGEQEDEVKQLVEELGLADLFIFAGFQSDVYPFYQLMDIFFLPSLYEGLPMVLLEAVGSGVPTISMNVGSIEEVIIPEKTGVLIEPNDYNEFVKQLVRFKNDASLREQVAKNGAEHVQSKFNINEYNCLLKSIYEQIMG